MIANFETIKKQLSELAEVVNAFKSKAVQLRIIELLLGAPPAAEPTQPSEEAKRPPAMTAPRPKARKTVPLKPEPPKSRKGSADAGPSATLSQLAASGFFNQRRTIADIVQHCRVVLKRPFKASDFSWKLTRMVRRGELTRGKNAAKRNTYKKP